MEMERDQRTHQRNPNNWALPQWEYDDAPRLSRGAEALFGMNESGCTPTTDEIGFLNNWTKTTDASGNCLLRHEGL